MLYLRISGKELCFARHDSAKPSDFQFSSYRLQPQKSLVANLREAVAQSPALTAGGGKVEALIAGQTTLVPLSEFQEEDCRALHDFCLPGEGARRVFYDIVPSANVVLLFSLPETVCHCLEETFGAPRFTSSRLALLQHFSSKGLGLTAGKRLFVYAEDEAADVSVYEGTRLLASNRFDTKSLSDVAYYAFALARQQALDLTEAPVLVAGETALRAAVAEEFQKYAARVYGINPAAEFNRSAAATAAGVPYDLVCRLLVR